MQKRKFGANYAKLTVMRPLKNFGAAYMPNMFYTKFVYQQDNYDFSTGVASYADRYFRGNSLYDPDGTGAGRTVTGHAEMGAIYTNYRVLASRITVEWYGVTFTQKGIKCHVFPRRDAAIGAGVQNEINTQPNQAACLVTEMEPKGKTVHYTTTGPLFGVSNANDIDFGAAFGANPNIQWYWLVAVTSGPGDVVKATITIEYYTICYSLKKTYGSAI